MNKLANIHHFRNAKTQGSPESRQNASPSHAFLRAVAQLLEIEPDPMLTKANRIEGEVEHSLWREKIINRS